MACGARFPAEFPLDCLRELTVLLRDRDRNSRRVLTAAAWSAGCLAELAPSPAECDDVIRRLSTYQILKELESAVTAFEDLRDAALSPGPLVWLSSVVAELVVRSAVDDL